jgi:signal transduction histidine kinase
LFGLLAVNELNGGLWLGYYPLKFSTEGGIWRIPEYALGLFVSFSCTVVLAQYLTRAIILRMTAKHEALEKDLRDRAEQILAINEMLKVTRVQMAQREKMVALGQMASGIAHEIGNPLASISSVVQYLCRKFSTHNEKEQLLLIGYHVDRISGILQRMLNLSRPATREYKWTDINELIESTLSLVKFDKRMASIAVKNATVSGLPTVWLNPQLFEQVLLNIFINAIDAMEAREDEREHILEITKESKDAMVEIQIRDTGVGMSPQVAKQAFESFYTTKEIGKGTGLGLFITYNLLSEINGTIELESEQGKGTTAIIRIPVGPQKNLLSPEMVK